MAPPVVVDELNDTRLIERWLPIEALGEESVRERRSLQALPPIYYLHVWWARRPLVASRAAVLASVLPASADRDRFLHAIGIHGDPIAAKKRIAQADRMGERLGKDAYGYPRAFSWSPDADDRAWMEENGLNEKLVVLDPTAGGGAIPFETARLGATALSNDLNPVAALIEKATIEYPLRHGATLRPAFDELALEFTARIRARLKGVYPDDLDENIRPDGYLWSRTIRCPYCDGLVPLSPNWRLTSDGTGVQLRPHLGIGPGDSSRRCDFIIVSKQAEQSSGTVADGDGTCPYPDCGRVIDGDDIKKQAQSGKMGEQLFTVVFKRRVEVKTKTGKRGRIRWVRGYRAPRPEDDNTSYIETRLAERMEEWEALDFVPNESIGELSNYDRGHRMYGMLRWADMFSPRQLLCHGTGVSIFRELLAERESLGALDDRATAAFVYLAITLDKFLNWNARQATWNVNLESMRSVFDTHNFSMKWTFAEMAPLIVGLGYDWVIGQVGKGIEELVALIRPDTDEDMDLIRTPVRFVPVTVNISCKSGDALDHIDDRSVDVVVMDPPYYDNVMYAELSDFFYVWLKRTAGHVVPELFTRSLTDKDAEAIANPAKFAGQKGAKVLAGREYQERMARVFEECRRVLKQSGIMTLMFTHKATGAWDALTKGLMQAGFTITASWPINTEAEGSLHIKNKSAANSTIFLVCRPRVAAAIGGTTNYWEDVEPLVASAVRTRVAEFQKAGIGGVDLYLACFGPALEEFSRHWPLKRGTPRAKPEALKRRRQAEMFEEEWDPYAVTPEDALDAARREVKRWRLEQLTHMKTNEELDPLTSFFVLAWDAFRAPVFPYDEALRLGRAVGVDLDKQVVGILMEKKGSDLVMWDSARRAAKGVLGPADGSRGMIDAIHHAAYHGRNRTLQVAREMLAKVGVDKEPMFFAALEAVLEVLPVGKAFSGIDLEGDLGAASSDFEVLENLRKLAFSEQVDAPKQLELWAEPVAA
jgi:adenine-specific DNA methylase